MNVKHIVPIAAVLFFTGCVTDPYTGEQKLSNSVKGALIGGIGCALAASTKSGKHARNAGLGCAAVGAGIGYYMDRQEAALRQRLKGSGVSIKRNGDDIQLILPSNITFISSSSDLSQGIRNTLSDVALVLKEFDKTSVKIVGHTDSLGSYEFNQKLSEKRARSVRWHLTQQGLKEGRLNIQGKSFSAPVASNDTASGRSQNRRVEISIHAL